MEIWLTDVCLPQCTTQVIAVTCEDGSCSLWFWSQSKCVGNLELPPGGSCYFPHIRLCDQMLSPLLRATSKQRFLLLLGDTILTCQYLLDCLVAAIHTPVVYTQIIWKHLQATSSSRSHVADESFSCVTSRMCMQS